MNVCVTLESVKYCEYIRFLQVVFARGCFDDTKVDIHEPLL